MIKSHRNSSLPDLRQSMRNNKNLNKEFREKYLLKAKERQLKSSRAINLTHRMNLNPLRVSKPYKKSKEDRLENKKICNLFSEFDKKSPNENSLKFFK